MVFGRSVKRGAQPPKLSSIDDAAALAPDELARISADVGRTVLGRKKDKFVPRSTLIDVLTQRGIVPDRAPDREIIGKYLLGQFEELNDEPIGTYPDTPFMFKNPGDYKRIGYHLVRAYQPHHSSPT